MVGNWLICCHGCLREINLKGQSFGQIYKSFPCQNWCYTIFPLQYVCSYILFSTVVNIHKKSDKKPDSSSSRHRTSQQSSIPSSIPSPKQGSLSSGNATTSFRIRSNINQKIVLYIINYFIISCVIGLGMNAWVTLKFTIILKFHNSNLVHNNFNIWYSPNVSLHS